jgi:hypothetical protein
MGGDVRTGARSEPMGKMDRKAPIFKRHTNISSQIGNGVVRKENHFQEHDIVFWKESGIVRKKRLRSPFSDSRKLSFQEANLSMETANTRPFLELSPETYILLMF